MNILIRCPCCFSGDVHCPDISCPILLCYFCGYQWDDSIPIDEKDISLYGHYFCEFSLISGDQPSLLIE